MVQVNIRYHTELQGRVRLMEPLCLLVYTLLGYKMRQRRLTEHYLCYSDQQSTLRLVHSSDYPQSSLLFTFLIIKESQESRAL